MPRVERLRRAVKPFTPALAAARADVPEEQITQAARIFAAAKRGLAVGGTGSNMSGHSTLIEYLMLCLNTICGRFVREGESIANPGVFLPRAIPKAQAEGPRPYEKLGVKMCVRGLEESACGLPTAALADQILHEGPERVRALFSTGGNPVAAWPDQQRTVAAIERLELCVQVDIKMSATAQMADYVIAPKVCFEVPCFSYAPESIEAFSVRALPRDADCGERLFVSNEAMNSKNFYSKSPRPNQTRVALQKRRPGSDRLVLLQLLVLFRAHPKLASQHFFVVLAEGRRRASVQSGAELREGHR